MDCISKANILYRERRYKEALLLYEKAKALYKVDWLDVNIRLCQKHYLSHLHNLPEKSSVAANPLSAALDIAEKSGVDEAIRFFQESSECNEWQALNIINAHFWRGDFKKWELYINRYLNHFGASAIEVDSNQRFLYFGISSKALRHVNGPLVSVVMPAFNAEDTLNFSINSILNQTWIDLELIIVDDCSNDATPDIALSWEKRDRRVKLIRNNNNVGPYVSKNRALEHCRGSFLTGHDADDWAHPERLERHVKYMIDNPEVKASAAKMFRVTRDGGFERISRKSEYNQDGVAQVAFISTMFDLSFFRSELGAWDCVRFGADSEIIYRTKKILGDNFRVLDQIGMICLDSEGGLTSHPEFGIKGGISNVRKKYAKAYSAWHEKLGDYRKQGQFYLPFPHHPRSFKVPAEMLVPKEHL